jgi:serine/threonine protein kinase
MGEVYRARDMRLGRDVAIKVLPERFAGDAQFQQRFEREARAVSSLQHPNICVLHDIGHDEAAGEFLVMELLEGETVAARLKRGKLPLPELLKIGMQIADALDKAHRKGVVHRDLKPANIMLTKAGAKLMDFGLAKPAALGAAGATGSAPPLSAAMTVTGASPITSPGSIVGTIEYMSPEQIEGKETDARSDIFAFGATLYEMATGVRAFEGKSQISVASAILEKEPEPISKSQPLAPAAFDRLVAQCLAKNPDDRFQAMHDVGLALKWVSEAAEAPGSSPAGADLKISATWRRALPWVVATVAILTAAALVFLRPSSSAPPLRKFDIHADKLSVQFYGYPRISPNGKAIAYVSGNELFVRELDQLGARRLYSPTGRLATFFWSPDSQSIGFWEQGKIWQIPVEGGSAREICAFPGQIISGAWSAGGKILFSAWRGDIYEVPAQGGDAKALGLHNPKIDVSLREWPVAGVGKRRQLSGVEPSRRGIVLCRRQGVSGVEPSRRGIVLCRRQRAHARKSDNPARAEPEHARKAFFAH